MRTLGFAKLEGSGNDFVIVEKTGREESPDPGIVKKICDRHLGVGADGLILYSKLLPTGPHFNMRLFNADGGEAEISGNGLRCLAAHIFHRRLHDSTDLLVQTRAGTKRVRKVGSSGAVFTFDVEMGRPILDPAKIPFRPASLGTSLNHYKLQVGEAIYSITVTSMGNPHCSIILEGFEGLDWKRIGSQIEVHPAFPERTNVEFIKIIDRRTIEVLFWERGVGATLSSGTGACAAMVASVLNGLVERVVRVVAQGGDLGIEWGADDLLTLAGPARMICEGEYFIDDDC